jgi:hypothetical protein
MIIRARLSGFFLCFVLGVVGGAQVQDAPSATDEHGGFGLLDQSGARLLVLLNHHDGGGVDLRSLTRPELLKTALCGGRRFTVRFERRQVEGPNDNGRQTSHNFDKLAGNVFTVLENTIDLDATCFLASETLLTGSVVLSLAAPIGPGACVQRDRFAARRGRSVTHCWPLARMASGQEVALLEFERRGKDALASLAVVDGTRTMMADYPAEFRGEGQDLWRADDGGVLSPTGFEIVCALQRGDWYALGIAWSGAEGRALSLWISEGGERFTKVIKDYWYHAPI